jgi:general secretion pathway protein G
MSRKGGLTAFARFCGLGLLAVSMNLSCFTLWFRIDTPEDRALLWVWDPLLGLLFAAAVLFLRDGGRSKWATFAQAVAAWVFVSGFCLLWHETQVRVRWTMPRTLAQTRVRLAQVALYEYARDCGGFPPQEKGLAALHTNPAVPGWAGPYIRAEDLTDPWGSPLEYRVHGNRVEVWSNGRDGKSGTEDDIRLDDTDDGRFNR